MSDLPAVCLPDGRRLVYAEWGDSHGQPVIDLHGTPGCRLFRHPDAALLAATGARLITCDRPGYGRSARKPGRSVADVATDVAALADALKLGEFAVTGASGGGPHALAVAAALPDRVTRAACVSGFGAYDRMDEGAYFAGMDPLNVREFGWALSGEEALTRELVREEAGMRERVERDPATLFGDFQLPDEDRSILGKSEYAALITEVTGEQCVNGVGGWVDDDLAFIRPWGFSVAAIRVPTAVWWNAGDVIIPPGHGEWIARSVPGAEVYVGAGGHQGDPGEDLKTLMRWLLNGVPRS
jgi:pimeloyl-ACP methyl ester carboxylesterase